MKNNNFPYSTRISGKFYEILKCHPVLFLLGFLVLLWHLRFLCVSGKFCSAFVLLGFHVFLWLLLIPRESLIRFSLFFLPSISIVFKNAKTFLSFALMETFIRGHLKHFRNQPASQPASFLTSFSCSLLPVDLCSMWHLNPFWCYLLTRVLIYSQKKLKWTSTRA